MFDKLGKKAVIAPLLIACVLCCILGLATAPMLRAEAHNVPFAIVNLDKGAVSVTGKTNVGQTLTEKLVSGEGSLGDMGSSSDDENEGSASNSSDSSASLSGAVKFTQLESERELQQALADNEYYGGIVIPANFTSQQVQSAVKLANAPQISVYLNKAKNPQMASTMQATLGQAMLQAGIGVDFKIVNDAEIGGGSMSSQMSVQMLVMPLFMLMMTGSMLTASILWSKDVTGLRRKNPVLAVLATMLAIAVFSGVFSGLVMLIDTVGGGMTLPVADLFPFVWFIAFCVMTCFVGLCCLCFPLGAAIAGAIFALGMGTAMLSPEMLPSFWADWVYPWAPQAVLGQGARSIIYLGHWPDISLAYPSMGMACAGLVALIVAACIDLVKKKPKKCEQNTEEPQLQLAAEGA